MSPHSFLNFSCFSKRVPTFLLTHPLSVSPFFLSYSSFHTTVCVYFCMHLFLTASPAPRSYYFFLYMFQQRHSSHFRAVWNRYRAAHCLLPERAPLQLRVTKSWLSVQLAHQNKKTPHLSMILFEWCPNISDLYHTILALEKKIHQKPGR